MPPKCNMDQNLRLNAQDGELIAESSSFGRLIGRLVYLTITRTDLTYAVHANLWTSHDHNTPSKTHSNLYIKINFFYLSRWIS
jgi:hypothetical protein